MAQERDDEVLISITLDEQAVTDRLVELRKTLTRLKAERAALEKDFKDGNLGLDDYAKSMNAIDRATKQTTNALAQNNRILDLAGKATKSSSGSLSQLRAQLSALKNAYADLTEEERDNIEIGGRLGKQIGDLNQQVKDIEASYGDFQRNVGNYSSAIKGGIEELVRELVRLQEQQKRVGDAQEYGQLQRQIIGFQQAINRAGAESGQTFDQVQDKVATYSDAIRDTVAELVKLEAEQKDLEEGSEAYERIGFKIAAMNKELAGTEKENKKVVDSLQDVDDNLGVLGGTVGDFRGKLEAAKQGLSAMRLGLTGLKGALAASGIGLLLLLLGSVVALFTKTQAGADLFSRKLAFLSGFVTALTQRAAALGGALLKLFTNPIEGWKQLKGVFSGAIDEATKAAKASEALEGRLQKLREAERALRVDRANSRAEIEKQKLLAEDVTKVQEVREAAAKRAFDIENGLLQRQTALQKERIDILRQQAKLNGNLVEDLDRVADAEEELGNIREESFGKQTELNNSLNSIRQEANQKAIQQEQKLRDVSLQAAKDRLKVIEEASLKLRDAMLAEGTSRQETEQQRLALFRLEEERIKKTGELRLLEEQNARIASLNVEKKTAEERRQLVADELRKGSEEEKLIRAETYAALLDLNKKFVQETAELDFARRQARIDLDLATATKGSRAEYEARKKALALERDLAKDNAYQHAQTWEEYDTQRRAIDAKYLKDAKELLRGFVGEWAGTAVRVLEGAGQTLSSIFDALSTTAQSKLDKQQQAALKSAGTNAELRQKIEDDFARKREELEKKAAKRRQKIASIENKIALARGITNVATSAQPLFLKLIEAGFVTAQALAQQALIDSQTFATGGVYLSDGQGSYVQGPGSGTSDSINARISNGESIVNAKSTAMFYDLLSAINVAGGGRAFPGVATPSSTGEVQPFQYGGVYLPDSSTDIAQAVRAALSDLNISVAVEDIDRVKGRMVEVQNWAVNG